MQQLDVLNIKLDALLKKYAALQAENKSLKDTVARQLQQIDALNEKVGRLEEDRHVADIGKVVADNTDKAGVRKQIDSLIGEIDKILITLND